APRPKPRTPGRASARAPPGGRAGGRPRSGRIHPAPAFRRKPARCRTTRRSREPGDVVLESLFLRRSWHLLRYADGDFGLEEVFAGDGGACQAAKHRDLTDVRERVGDRSLKEPFGGACEPGVREMPVQPRESSGEANDFRIPILRGRFLPGVLT